MKILQSACMAMLALSANAWATAVVTDPAAGTARELRDSVAIDESINLNNNPGWETPDLPYARLLASSSALNAAPHWSSAVARHGALAPARTASASTAQQPAVLAPVPEASMYSMLLVGLGLLAFSVHGEKQEKFDG